MIRSLKNWLSQNSDTCKKQGRVLLALLFFTGNIHAQINFVSNPSFEDKYTCTIGLSELFRAKFWNALDSTKLLCGGDYYHACSTNMNATTTPSNVFSYQYPRTGKAYALSGYYCPPPTCSSSIQRGYMKNRLKNNLIVNTTYCVKMYVNLVEKCNLAIDALHIYLGDSNVDTIGTCSIPLTYITPQITNTLGIIADTANWIEVSGTFTASGNEKYLIIGNFLPNSSVNSSTVNTGQSDWSAYNVDDVSVIDFNLPAYAGPDKNIFLGDSTFIGRPPEIGLDCTWTSGTITVGDSAGIWVKPSSPGTYSYVVTQNICGNIKTDTVNINVSPSSINENTMFGNSIGIYPQPAKDLVNISLSYFYDPTVEIKITDVTGKMIRNESLVVRNGKTSFNTSEFHDGVYLLQIISKNQIAQKRVIVSK